MKNILFIVFVMLGFFTNAQVNRVTLKASGLTCSMCSNSIYKALKKLDFIDKIETDLKAYTFEISFTKNGSVNFDQIRARVESAGFSVADFTAEIPFDNVTVNNDQSITTASGKLIPLTPVTQLLNGTIKVRFLDKGFVLPKEYRNSLISNSLADDQTYHVTLL